MNKSENRERAVWKAAKENLGLKWTFKHYKEYWNRSKPLTEFRSQFNLLMGWPND